MKWLQEWLDQIFDWAQDYGWSIPIFGLGVLFGLSLAISLGNPAAWLSIATALGTLGAAFAAFWSINFSRRVQRNRDRREDVLLKPLLHIFHVEQIQDADQPQYVLHIANLSQKAVFISEVVTFRPQRPPPNIETSHRSPVLLDFMQLVVPGGATAKKQINLVLLTEPGKSDLYFYFTYAATGSAVHRLKLSVELRSWQDFNLQNTFFSLGQQPIEEFVESSYSNHAIGFIRRDNQSKKI